MSAQTHESRGCMHPVKLSDGQDVQCRKCEKCRLEWRRYWTGRISGECHIARSVWFSTLTYGGGYDNADAYVKRDWHLRNYVKKLRRLGYDFSYIGVFEHGEKEGRGHWHMLMMWHGDSPPAKMDEMDSEWTYRDRYGRVQEYWSHGHVKHEWPRNRAHCAAYVLKYIDKDGTSAGDFVFPRNPMLGHRYLIGYAEKRADAGLALFGYDKPTFTVPGNVRDRGPNAGKPYEYWLDTQSSLYRDMVAAYLSRWVATRPRQIIPFCRHSIALCQGLTGEERQALLPDAVSTHLAWTEANIYRCRFTDPQQAGKSRLAYYACDWHKDAVLVVDEALQVAELRIYKDEAITWRKAVGAKEKEGLLRQPPRHLPPVQVLQNPRDERLGNSLLGRRPSNARRQSTRSTR